MANIKEQLESLPEPFRTQALMNMNNTKAHREADKKSTAISEAFSWGNTPQGSTYWGNLHNKYQDDGD